MKSFDQLRNFKDLREQMKAFTEPASTRQATSRVSEILDAKYEKANLPSIVESATHLTTTQRAGLLKALLRLWRVIWWYIRWLEDRACFPQT